MNSIMFDVTIYYRDTTKMPENYLASDLNNENGLFSILFENSTESIPLDLIAKISAKRVETEEG